MKYDYTCLYIIFSFIFYRSKITFYCNKNNNNNNDAKISQK